MALSSKLLRLSNGTEIPVVGFGTSSVDDVYTVICWAIDAGYRHIDTAYAYGNEGDIGRAIADKIRQGVVTRDQLWITSKVWNGYHREKQVEECFEKSAQELGVEYLDLYLIHCPIAFKEPEPTDDEPPESSDVDFLETWKGMENLYKQGKVRNIGLSNFNSEQVDRILSSCEIRPVINQVEAHVYLNQEKLRAFCAQRGITLTAYCPLGSPGRKKLAEDAPRLMADPVIKELAAKYEKGEAQLLIRWLIQRGMVVIPKSANQQRIYDNLNIFDFEITTEDMDRLIGLNRNYRFITLSNYDDHKNYPFAIEF